MRPRGLAAAALLLFAAACVSHRDADDGAVPQTVPPADLQANAQLEARVTELQTSMTELLERLDVMNDRLSKIEAGSTPASRAADHESTVPPAAVPRTETAASAPPRAVVSAQIAGIYRNALMLYAQGKPDEARRTFQQVFDTEPTGDLADNALYWIGETWFAAGNYAEAMKFYKRVATEFSETNKAPDALFKMALSFEKQSDLGMARNTLEDVIRRYPYSSAAASAKLELKRIKY